MDLGSSNMRKQSLIMPINLYGGVVIIDIQVKHQQVLVTAYWREVS